MMAQNTLQLQDILLDLQSMALSRDGTETVQAALRLLAIYRSLAPLGERVLALPPAWGPGHGELFFLFKHHAEDLSQRRPDAQLIKTALGGGPPACSPLPVVEAGDLLARMNRLLDGFAPVQALTDSDRVMLPLHVTEILAASEAIAQQEAWLMTRPDRPRFMPLFLWTLADTLTDNLYCPHLVDKSAGERGAVAILEDLLAIASE